MILIPELCSSVTLWYRIEKLYRSSNFLQYFRLGIEQKGLGLVFVTDGWTWIWEFWYRVLLQVHFLDQQKPNEYFRRVQISGHPLHNIKMKVCVVNNVIYF